MNILLNQIQRSQLAENIETYFELIGNYLFKSKHEDIYGMMGLNKKYPYADGLENSDYAYEEGSKGRVPDKQFSFNYIHNKSASENNLESNKSHLVKEVYTSKVREQAYKGFYRVIKIMKDSSLSNLFPKILENIWCLVQMSQMSIE